MDNWGLSPVFLLLGIFFPTADPFFKNELRTCPYEGNPKFKIVMTNKNNSASTRSGRCFPKGKGDIACNLDHAPTKKRGPDKICVGARCIVPLRRQSKFKIVMMKKK